MPGESVVLTSRLEDFGQSSVRAVSLRQHRGAVDRRPHERMAKTQLAAFDSDEIRSLGCFERSGVDAEAGGGAEDDIGGAGVVGGSDE